MLPFRHLLLLVVSLLCCCSSSHGLGGEKPAFLTTPASSKIESHRQDVCERYHQFRAGVIELRDALSGLSVRPVIVLEGNNFFNFSFDKGIASKDPGILVEIIDEIAKRANFTWRNSFAVTGVANDYNMTWTELLLWSVKHYDTSLHAWDQTADRMERGITFTEPWYDSSLILIDHRVANEESTSFDLFNWTKPFAASVWGMIVLTIFMSAFVYLLIEHMNGEREDRSAYQWISDNLYLSALNFSQNFEYAPNSFAGRIFGVSMTIWALVIAATYTANLASLFVEARSAPVLVDSMDAAVVYGYPVCTFAHSNDDYYIRDTYPKAQRVPKVDEMSSYEALRNGECALAVTAKDMWLTGQVDEAYNPDCNLEWVGQVVKDIESGFAFKADTGHKCGSLVRHVINMHLMELIEEGFVAEVWRKYREIEDDGLCVYNDDEEDHLGRRLQSQEEDPESHTLSRDSHDGLIASFAHRILKGGGKPAGGGADATGIDADTLTLQHMLGTFIFHWAAMAVAVVVGCATAYYDKVMANRDDGKVVERVTHRTHGPIIGSPPPINTHVVRDLNTVREQEQALDDDDDDDDDSNNDDEHGGVGSGEDFDEEFSELVAKQIALEDRLARVEQRLGWKMDKILQMLQRETFV